MNRLLLFAFIVLIGCNNQPDKKPVPLVTPKFLWGERIDGFLVDTTLFGKGATLSGLLAQYNITGTIAQAIIDSLADKTDLKKIKSNSKVFKIYSKKDTLFNVLMIDIDELNIAKIIRNDTTFKVAVFKRALKINNKSLAASIKGSLYQTVQNNGVNSMLAIEMAKIYDWTIDFFQLQEGDKFKVLYKEIAIDGKPAGIEEINALVFEIDNKTYYAFPYKKIGSTMPVFYNEKGENMKTRYLKAPLDFTRISSAFSSKRFHPVLKINKPHLGVDYAAPAGTPVRAIGDGVITEASYKIFNGNYVKIRHNKQHETQYLHLKGFSKIAKKGRRVAQGQIIGYVGRTGLATGAHLCFRFWNNGVQVNPKKMQGPPPVPIERQFKADFLHKKDSLMNVLNRLTF